MIGDIVKILESMQESAKNFQNELKQIFDDWHKENERIFEEWQKQNQKLFDDYQIKRYNENLHAQYMLKFGGKK